MLKVKIKKNENNHKLFSQKYRVFSTIKVIKKVSKSTRKKNANSA